MDPFTVFAWIMVIVLGVVVIFHKISDQRTWQTLDKRTSSIENAMSMWLQQQQQHTQYIHHQEPTDNNSSNNNNNAPLNPLPPHVTMGYAQYGYAPQYYAPAPQQSMPANPNSSRRTTFITSAPPGSSGGAPNAAPFA